jgi:hypothetical protein
MSQGVELDEVLEQSKEPAAEVIKKKSEWSRMTKIRKRQRPKKSREDKDYQDKWFLVLRKQLENPIKTTKKVKKFQEENLEIDGVKEWTSLKEAQAAKEKYILSKEESMGQ